MCVYLGLGSNLENELGTPRKHLTKATKQIALLGHIQASSLYKSAPLGPQDQPDFFNAVIKLCPFDEDMTALDLLAFVQQIENEAKRERLRHWGERSLDIDILLFKSEVSTTQKLTLPHYGILDRNFVAVPLLEVAPNIAIANKKLSEQAIAYDNTGLEVIEDASWIGT